MLPGGAFSVVLHFLLSLPMRRRDRALFFLDLVETVVNRGQPVEQAILSAAENQDRAIGVRFFMVAAHIEGGARLGEALEKVPTFLPPQVNAMIRAGEKLGDLKKVLPACREVLRVAPGHRPHHHALHGRDFADFCPHRHLPDFAALDCLSCPSSRMSPAAWGWRCGRWRNSFLP